MDRPSSQRARELLGLASELSPEDQRVYLDRVCEGDEVLRSEVEALLAAREENEPTIILDYPETSAARTIGVYRIEERIGAGGMGEVWSATDTRLRRRVAIKFLPPRVTADASRVSRFENEARTASALNHPNILTVHELGEAGSMHYIVTELVEGRTLRERMNEGPLPLDEALELGQQIASALAAAHEAGVVHRDIKPENVMIRPDGLVKVLDFGLAKLVEQTPGEIASALTKEGSVLGTPSYMSPEQLRGEPIDPRSDVWSLGVVIFEMITGRRPFLGEPSDMVARILRDDPPSMRSLIHDLPQPVESLIVKALQKERAKRHASAREMLEGLRAVEPDRVPISASPGGRRLSRSAVASVVVVAALLLGITSALLLRRSEGDAVAPRPEAIRSIAVLPFANLSGAAENEHLSDGMTDELIHALGKVPGLNVVSRTSSFALKGQTGDVRELGRRLDVGALVDGSVNKSGNRLRVTAQLVSAVNGYQLWSEVYDRELTDVFAIQEEIATAVARALATRVGERPLVTVSTGDMEAYELYLKGRQASQNWGRAESLNIAISHYREALARDPSFASAWAGLADVYSLMDHTLGVTSLPPAETYRLARQAADRALELEPASAEALAALGHIEIHQGDFVAAEGNLRRAVELNPSSGMARLWFAVLFRALGRNEDSAEQFRRALEVDPLSHHVHSMGSTGLWAAGEYDLAAEFARGAINISPDVPINYYSLARGLVFAGRYADAENALEDAISLARPTAPGAERALILAVMGRRDEAVEILRAIDQKPVEKLEPLESPVRTFRAWAAVGDLDKASQWLNRSIEANPYYARVNIGLPPHPVFSSFLADSRYQEARRGLGLPPIR
jgi:eukaryotic-like serine/threonine-protein kinase